MRPVYETESESFLTPLLDGVNRVMIVQLPEVESEAPHVPPVPGYDPPLKTNWTPVNDPERELAAAVPEFVSVNDLSLETAPAVT